MLNEFPAPERHNRLRCYGFGVPNLEQALWSVSSAATLIIEESLQPYEGSGSDIRTKDMHRHELPWPKQILEALGDVQVRMRVTLQRHLSALQNWPLQNGGFAGASDQGHEFL